MWVQATFVEYPRVNTCGAPARLVGLSGEHCPSSKTAARPHSKGAEMGGLQPDALTSQAPPPMRLGISTSELHLERNRPLCLGSEAVSLLADDERMKPSFCFQPQAFPGCQGVPLSTTGHSGLFTAFPLQAIGFQSFPPI